MTDDRISGSAKNIGGQVEEGFGRVTGDEKTQLQGKAKQAEGTLQDVYGQAKETAADAAEAIRERASEAGDFLRTTIEERPIHRRGHCARHRFLDRPLRPPLRLLGQRAKLTAQFANYALALAHLGDLKPFATSALGSTRTNSANSSLENYSPAEWLPPSETESTAA